MFISLCILDASGNVALFTLYANVRHLTYKCEVIAEGAEKILQYVVFPLEKIFCLFLLLMETITEAK